MAINVIDIKDKKVALMGLKHNKSDKIIIADSSEELWYYTRHKDMVSMIHYEELE